MEVDPIVQRALQFLISRKPNSGEKLKQMLFDSLGREYVPPSAEQVKEKLKRQMSHSQGSVESFDDDEAIDMGAETDCSTDVGGARNDDTMDADDFAFDMGISCVICRQFDVSSNNQLLECQDCHSLYHQLCHKPPVTDNQDVNDPRFVWHCHKCAASCKKSPEKVKVIEIDDDSPVKQELTEAFKRPDKKTERTLSEAKKSSDSSKDKKVKSEKKSKDKDKVGEKSKETEKDKVKKHKTSDKETKTEGSHTRKDKVSSKSSDSSKFSSSASGKTGSSTKEKGGESRSDKHKQSSSDLKHKKSESHHDKEKKAKKIKKEKAD